MSSDVSGITPLESLLTNYAAEYLARLQRLYRRYEQLVDCEQRPEPCKHAYAGTCYGDGVICTPCATNSSTWADAMRLAQAEISKDRRGLAEQLANMAREDCVELLTPHELQLLGSLISELETHRC